MNKVIIIIGASCTGKTTYIRNNFLKNYASITFIEKPFKMTVIDNNILLLGHHKGEKRCEGSDELSMSILPKLIEFIKNNITNYDTIIMEGDRINNSKFFNFVVSLKVPVKLYVLTCSLETSIKRRQQTGSKPSETFVKTTITKSENMRKLGRQLGFDVQIINTDDKKQSTFTDFIGN